MNKTVYLKVRVTEQERKDFKKKADAEYGSISECLRLQVRSIIEAQPLANDAELTALLYVVRALNSYCNNINQIAKKLNRDEDVTFSFEEANKVRCYTVDVIKKFKSCLNTRKNTFGNDE